LSDILFECAARYLLHLSVDDSIRQLTIRQDSLCPRVVNICKEKGLSPKIAKQIEVGQLAVSAVDDEELEDINFVVLKRTMSPYAVRIVSVKECEVVEARDDGAVFLGPEVELLNITHLLILVD
jgi:hypothetical protein